MPILQDFVLVNALLTTLQIQFPRPVSLIAPLALSAMEIQLTEFASANAQITLYMLMMRPVYVLPRQAALRASSDSIQREFAWPFAQQRPIYSEILSLKPVSLFAKPLRSNTTQITFLELV
jgi:hypothetical protein